jgi:hypothetical protein
MCSSLLRLKIENAMAKFKNDQPFFSYYDLSNHTTYGHTEGGVRESFAA